jgi:hypothetical protein
MSKTVRTFVVAACITVLSAGSALSGPPAEGRAPSTADAFKIDDRIYKEIVRRARLGDCDAAFTLARHHVFYTTNDNEAIRWFRVAAKCPNVNAKGELLVLLMHDPEHDAEVDRLLVEIEQLDPETARRDREEVRRVRNGRVKAH